MGLFDHLKTLDQVNAERRAVPKHKITPAVLAQEARRKGKADKAAAFRKDVWARDGGMCRATGVPLAKSGTDAHRVGEVDHGYLRSTSPDRIYDVKNGVLLSRFLNRLRKVACPEAPEFRMFDYSGPDDRGKPQRFVWRDRAGKVIREVVG